MSCGPSQAIQKARESPGFAAKAATAQAAYREQIEDATAALGDFVEQHGLSDKQRLTWQHRPKVPQVETPAIWPATPLKVAQQ